MNPLSPLARFLYASAFLFGCALPLATSCRAQHSTGWSTVKSQEIAAMPVGLREHVWADSVKYQDPIDQYVMLFAAPDFYYVWWAKVEECSGLKGDPRTWEFVSVRAGSFPVGGAPQVGYTFHKNREIWAIQNGIDKEQLIKHEMLHAILFDNGIFDNHPRQYFEESCRL